MQDLTPAGDTKRFAAPGQKARPDFGRGAGYSVGSLVVRTRSEAADFSRSCIGLKGKG
jgi:hypothetical protein